MEKEFVPYNSLVKLKELGCYKSFKTVIKEKLYYVDSGGNETDDYLYKDKIIEGILWQQAFDWFRENHNIIIQPLSVWETEEEIDYIKNKPTGYIMDLFLYDSDFTQNTATIYKTYEKARLACLEKSIELLKEIGN